MAAQSTTPDATANRFMTLFWLWDGFGAARPSADSMAEGRRDGRAESAAPE